MARPKKNPNDKLMPVGTAIKPETLRDVQKIATHKQWTFAQALRRTIEAGTKVELRRAS